MHADTATWTVNSNETWVHKRLKPDEICINTKDM